MRFLYVLVRVRRYDGDGQIQAMALNGVFVCFTVAVAVVLFHPQIEVPLHRIWLFCLPHGINLEN